MHVTVNFYTLFSGEELLLTEMIFTGAFNDLSVEQCVALLSCFVFQEKASLLYNITCTILQILPLWFCHNNSYYWLLLMETETHYT